jgi:hypothetical protein
MLAGHEGAPSESKERFEQPAHVTGKSTCVASHHGAVIACQRGGKSTERDDLEEHFRVPF